MLHIRKMMSENNTDVIFLARGSRSAMFKRLANTGSGSALLIPIDGNPVLYVFPVDYESTKDESWIQVKRIDVRDALNESIATFINEHARTRKSRVGACVADLSMDMHAYMKDNLKAQLVDISSTMLPEVFFGLYPEEIKYQRTVSQLADISVAAARESMSPGVKEHEIAAEANYAMMRRGAEQQSFATIVSSGERSAYCHGYPGDRALKIGDLVIVDLGPMKMGYASDETRTYLLGKDEKKEKMLKAVDRSVQAVLDAIKPGASCKELDAVSRKALRDQGFADYPHSLGHSLSGFPVPALSKQSLHTLKEGMLFTVEPGIYLPGYGGVRIEENVVVTDYGCEQLTKSPRLP